ncbi:hypothetical protein OBV_13350 [Oscillibacter valericigenes Sjm18-20]|nr:hypothetical protein OBV_13350 [Oscillibacter valericigenes Sjm18-20]
MAGSISNVMKMNEDVTGKISLSPVCLGAVLRKWKSWNGKRWLWDYGTTPLHKENIEYC